MADFVFVDKEKEKKKKLIRILIIACIPVLILAGFGVKYLLSFTGAENTAAAVVKSADVTASQEIETEVTSDTEAQTAGQTYTSAPETTSAYVYTTGAPATQAERAIAGENYAVTSSASRAASTTHAAPVVREPGESYSYVLNINTMRIHYPYCDSVDQMADKNKAYSDTSVAELKAEGYVPCGNCKPN